MNKATLNKCNELRKIYTQEEIRRIFRNRVDDEFFISLGAGEMPVSEQRASEPHHLVWLGYHLLVKSKYLET